MGHHSTVSDAEHGHDLFDQVVFGQTGLDDVKRITERSEVICRIGLCGLVVIHPEQMIRLHGTWRSALREGEFGDRRGIVHVDLRNVVASCDDRGVGKLNAVAPRLYVGKELSGSENEFHSPIRSIPILDAREQSCKAMAGEKGWQTG